ncbi:MAG: hypothetical protein FWE32_05760 [Oscillospiraceae bacterium]|nr:hypothetical protein [Oscillospiraceae bacterium]
MQINPVASSGQTHTAQQSGQGTAAQTQAPQTSAPQNNQPEDRFVRSNYARPDTERLSEIRAEHARNVSAFRTMVAHLIGGQVNQDGRFELVLEIDEALQLQAQEAISDMGDWGVEAVADRILDFAYAISGGDPSFINMLRHSFEAGFAAVERMFGGTLPEISHQTRERVLEGFRNWEETGSIRPASVEE